MKDAKKKIKKKVNSSHILKIIFSKSEKKKE